VYENALLFSLEYYGASRLYWGGAPNTTMRPRGDWGLSRGLSGTSRRDLSEAPPPRGGGLQLSSAGTVKG